MTGRLRWISVALAALLVVAIGWLLLSGSDDGDKEPVAISSSYPATIVSAEELSDVADSLEHPVYWLGERPGTRLELTRESNGDVYVRYLTGDAEPGDPRQDYVTVGTYPVTDAVAAVHRAAAQEGTGVRSAPGGGVVFSSPKRPENVYLAYPNSEYQIEVFAPGAGEASELVSSGGVIPVD